jgi:hypothetical protein
VPKGIMLVQTSPVDPAKEDAYNDWYDNTHIPEILEVPGFTSARRYKVNGPGAEGAHSYLAIYEIDADDLTAPVAELGKRAAAGQSTMSDALGMDPAPVITVYESRD